METDPDMILKDEPASRAFATGIGTRNVRPAIALTLSVRGLTLAGRLVETAETTPPAWGLEPLLGRMVELSGGPDSANLTVCAGLIREAQVNGEFAVWAGQETSGFFPPDFADQGIDLDALPVVRAANRPGRVRAAEALLRSGGFALVVLDLGDDCTLRPADQTRLAGLASKGRTALVILTRKPAGRPSIGSLVSLHAETSKERAAFDRFICRILIVKDKRRGPGRRHEEFCHGADGLH